jgi:myo-inositol-1(or 4)-monophosphatase
VSELRTIAEIAARAGSTVLLEHAGRITGLRAKSGAADLVSAADIGAGVAIAAMIAEHLPGARFVIEEPEVYELAGVACGSLEDPQVWVIDPLDGTTSFVHSYPCWSVSVACLRFGVPTVGVVLNVPAGELASAERGLGATLNGNPLVCEGSPVLEGALLGTGFPYDRGEPLDRQLRLLERLLRPAHDIRRDGSAAVDLVNVAAGRTDGFWETALQPWDMAAGVLVVTEAGGVVTDFAGRPWSPATRDVVAANPALQRVLIQAIADAEGR